MWIEGAYTLCSVQSCTYKYDADHRLHMLAEEWRSNTIEFVQFNSVCAPRNATWSTRYSKSACALPLQSSIASHKVNALRSTTARTRWPFSMRLVRVCLQFSTFLRVRVSSVVFGPVRNVHSHASCTSCTQYTTWTYFDSMFSSHKFEQTRAKKERKKKLLPCNNKHIANAHKFTGTRTRSTYLFVDARAKNSMLKMLRHAM